MRWVIRRKIDGKNVTKARLCARGFEELTKFPYRLAMLLMNRSKISICTNCFAKLEYQFDRYENSVFARKKNRKNYILAPT